MTQASPERSPASLESTAMSPVSEPVNTNVAHAMTLPQLCLAALRRHDKADSINHKQTDEWLNVSAREFIKRVRHVALGLRRFGVERGDRVALMSENRVEWSIADLAILSLGAVNVPLYTTQAPEQVRFILADSGARVLLISTRKIYRHAEPGIKLVETLEHVVFFDDDAAQSVRDAQSLSQLEAAGALADREDEGAYERFIGAIEPDDLATIIYTSGTTGDPKGVMLSHRNFVTDVVSISNSLPIYATDTALSVLPLSHIFERTCFYLFCHAGVSVYYAASFDQVGAMLQEVRPTLMTAVPRLFEKVYHRIVKKGMAAEGAKRRIFQWALKCGTRYAELQDKRARIGVWLAAQHQLADKLVFTKWREGVGGRLRYFVSGGASLSPQLAYAFIAAGIPILEGYGMTETCITSANRPGNTRVGSVGFPFSGIEHKIAADGEILVRGANVMRGYYGHPEATAAAFTGDGWFQTGDVGRIDDEGRLYITDRKKELFKLSNGKYIAPQLVESFIKQSAFVNQVVVVGAGRKQPIALIAPDWDALEDEMQARSLPIPETREAWSRDAAAVRIVQQDVSALTSGLADYERVRRVALLPEELTIDGGELTPTLKIKRRVIDERYGALIESLYVVDSG